MISGAWVASGTIHTSALEHTHTHHHTHTHRHTHKVTPTYTQMQITHTLTHTETCSPMWDVCLCCNLVCVPSDCTGQTGRLGFGTQVTVPLCWENLRRSGYFDGIYMRSAHLYPTGQNLQIDLKLAPQL